jgi:hypothetical protein
MSSVSSLYRRYLLVCSQWSIDTTKSGRDFGSYLRNQIPKVFPNGELTDFSFDDIKKYEKQIESLERINQNIHFKHGFVESSASGLTADQCKQIISTQSLQEFNRLSDLGILDRIKLRFGNIRLLRTHKQEDQQKADF